MVGLSTEEEEEEEEVEEDGDGEIGILAVFRQSLLRVILPALRLLSDTELLQDQVMCLKGLYCRVREFRAVLYVKANGHVGAIPT